MRNLKAFRYFAAIAFATWGLTQTAQGKLVGFDPDDVKYYVNSDAIAKLSHCEKNTLQPAGYRQCIATEDHTLKKQFHEAKISLPPKIYSAMGQDCASRSKQKLISCSAKLKNQATECDELGVVFGCLQENIQKALTNLDFYRDQIKLKKITKPLFESIRQNLLIDRCKDYDSTVVSAKCFAATAFELETELKNAKLLLHDAYAALIKRAKLEQTCREDKRVINKALCVGADLATLVDFKVTTEYKRDTERRNLFDERNAINDANKILTELKNNESTPADCPPSKPGKQSTQPQTYHVSFLLNQDQPLDLFKPVDSPLPPTVPELSKPQAANSKLPPPQPANNSKTTLTPPLLNSETPSDVNKVDEKAMLEELSTLFEKNRDLGSYQKQVEELEKSQPKPLATLKPEATQPSFDQALNSELTKNKILKPVRTIQLRPWDQDAKAMPVREHLRSKEDFVKAGEQQLKSIKAGKPEKIAYGEFFLEGELIREGATSKQYQAFQKLWHQNIAKYKFIVAHTEGTVDDKIDALISELHADYFKDYSRDDINFVDFLKGKGGNCQANTKLLLAAFSESGIVLDSEHLLGVQVFSDHVQPVLYNPKTKVVRSLISGEKVNGVTANIFKPEITVQTYVDQEGGATVLSPEELLLAPGTASTSYNLSALAGFDFKLLSRAFEKRVVGVSQFLSGPAFSNGKIPEKAISAKPQKSATAKVTEQKDVKPHAMSTLPFDFSLDSKNQPPNSNLNDESFNQSTPGAKKHKTTNQEQVTVKNPGPYPNAVLLSETKDDPQAITLLGYNRKQAAKNLDKKPLQLFQVIDPLYSSPSNQVPEPHILFRNAKDLKHYQSLKTTKEKIQYLVELRAQEVESFLKTKAVSNALRIQANPALLFNGELSPTEVQEATNAYKQLNHILINGVTVGGDDENFTSTLSLKDPDTFMDFPEANDKEHTKYEGWNKYVLKRLPALTAFFNSYLKAASSWHKNPEAIFKLYQYAKNNEATQPHLIQYLSENRSNSTNHATFGQFSIFKAQVDANLNDKIYSVFLNRQIVNYQTSIQPQQITTNFIDEETANPSLTESKKLKTSKGTPAGVSDTKKTNDPNKPYNTSLENVQITSSGDESVAVANPVKKGELKPSNLKPLPGNLAKAKADAANANASQPLPPSKIVFKSPQQFFDLMLFLAGTESFLYRPEYNYKSPFSRWDEKFSNDLVASEEALPLTAANKEEILARSFYFQNNFIRLSKYSEQKNLAKLKIADSPQHLLKVQRFYLSFIQKHYSAQASQWMQALRNNPALAVSKDVSSDKFRLLTLFGYYNELKTILKTKTVDYSDLLPKKSDPYYQIIDQYQSLDNYLKMLDQQLAKPSP